VIIDNFRGSGEMVDAPAKLRYMGIKRITAFMRTGSNPVSLKYLPGGGTPGA